MTFGIPLSTLTYRLIEICDLLVAPSRVSIKHGLRWFKGLRPTKSWYVAGTYSGHWQPRYYPECIRCGQW